MKVELPFPHKNLNPNRSKKLHWGTLSRLTSASKGTAFALTKQAMGRDTITGPITVLVSIYPPNRNKRDKDNAIAQLKATQDGVALAIGIDDAEWNVDHKLHKEPLNKVVFEITNET